MVSWKNPLPLIATSRLLPVMLMFPCVNCCATVPTATPIPGVMFPPAGPNCVAISAENSVREDFIPTVLALAMLLPITSRFLLEAFRPESPV